VTALDRLRKSQETLKVWGEGFPVFRVDGGKILTKTVFLEWVNRAKGSHRYYLSGKSFRSAIPSILENFPTSFCEAHLKALGRWLGFSYQRYMRNDPPEFEWVFRTVADTIFKINSPQEGWQENPPTWTVCWASQKGKSPRKRKTIPTRKGSKTGRKTSRIKKSPRKFSHPKKVPGKSMDKRAVGKSEKKLAFSKKL
jgi:hypothetical protein